MNPTWLVPVDGSTHALRAIEHVIKEAANRHVSPNILLLNVQAPLPSDVVRFVDSSVVQEYHHEAGAAALTTAHQRVQAAGLSCTQHVLVGETAHAIVEFAREKHCDLIVIGARGLGSVAGLLLGSVTSRVVHLSELPVLVVK